MSNHEFCKLNCGGTGCLAKNSPRKWTTTPECKHENGYFLDVKFWIFTKEIFFCEDCLEQLKPELIRNKSL